MGASAAPRRAPRRLRQRAALPPVQPQRRAVRDADGWIKEFRSSNLEDRGFLAFGGPPRRHGRTRRGTRARLGPGRGPGTDSEPISNSQCLEPPCSVQRARAARRRGALPSTGACRALCWGGAPLTPDLPYLGRFRAQGGNLRPAFEAPLGVDCRPLKLLRRRFPTRSLSRKTNQGTADQEPGLPVDPPPEQC